MSDMLSIGASGVRAYQVALNTVSENIANASTPGYSRRTTTISQIGNASGGLATKIVAAGQGSIATGIARAGEAMKTQAVLSSSADLASTTSSVSWMTRIDSALSGNALGDRLTSFYNAAQTLSADPTSVASRATLLEQGTSVAAAFTATGKALDQAGVDLDTTATQGTQKLDQLAAALAKVNDGLGRAVPGTSASADLADQRDQLVEQMSAITDVSMSTDNYGRATVRVGGASGATMVSGTQSGAMTYVRGDDGAVSFAVHMAGEATIVTPSGGALAGIADGAQRITAARTSLNAMATGFVATTNAAQTGGDDLDGRAGTAMFATGTSPTAITLALTDPRGVAAARTGGGRTDASNLAVLQAARKSGGYEAGLTSMVSTNAAALSARQLVSDAQSAIRDGAVASRDAVSGVNLDSEAVDLLKFQQAYQASSRVIQVAQDVFSSILALK